ncbi:MAG: DUF1499 domain-containing protein [Myxococcota bacterium]
MSAWRVPSLIIAALLASGPLAAHFEILSPLRGFEIFGVGVVLALLSAIALGGAAAYAALYGRAWRRAAVRAALLPIGVVVVVLGLQAQGGGGPFNDVTTDLEDPPVFHAGPAAGIGYPEDFVAMQRKQYPDLGPRHLSASVEASWTRALEAARAMPRWQITSADPDAGQIEAVATTRVFRFRDDIAVRLRPEQAPPGAVSEGSDTRIDIRSRSRDGRGDLGANAARIRRYLAALGGV